MRRSLERSLIGIKKEIAAEGAISVKIRPERQSRSGRIFINYCAASFFISELALSTSVL